MNPEKVLRTSAGFSEEFGVLSFFRRCVAGTGFNYYFGVEGGNDGRGGGEGRKRSGDRDREREKENRSLKVEVE